MCLTAKPHATKRQDTLTRALHHVRNPEKKLRPERAHVQRPSDEVRVGLPALTTKSGPPRHAATLGTTANSGDVKQKVQLVKGGVKARGKRFLLDTRHV